MAIHQRYRGFIRNININLPDEVSGHLYMRVAGGSNVKFNKPKDSQLAMLFNNGKRVVIQ